MKIHTIVLLALELHLIDNTGCDKEVKENVSGICIKIAILHPFGVTI